MTRIYGGTSLGLAIANLLVQPMREPLWTKSKVCDGTKSLGKIQQFIRSWPAVLTRSGDSRVSPSLCTREGLTGSAP